MYMTLETCCHDLFTENVLCIFRDHLCDPFHLDWVQMGARSKISILFEPGEENWGCCLGDTWSSHIWNFKSFVIIKPP